MESLRPEDMCQERIVARYLDEKLYSRKEFSRASRTDDISNQMRGSDIILSIPNSRLVDAIVDEKAQLHYLNGGLPTFAFELSFRKSDGMRVKGWLIDENKSTQMYMLLWLTAKSNFKGMEEISCIEYALVPKISIIQFLAGYGVTPISLEKKVEEIIRKGAPGQIEKVMDLPFYYFYSTNLWEKPVNIVLKKNKLLEMAIIKGRI